MPIDRAAALRNAEKLLRQGRLDQAIAEYRRIVEEQPNDWNTANLLGDLYARSGHSRKAIEQFIRVADTLSDQGFISKASAVYKKVLKLEPDHEAALVKASEIARRQGLLADERGYLCALADARRKRGDERGASEIDARVASLYSSAGRYAVDLAAGVGQAPPVIPSIEVSPPQTLAPAGDAPSTSKQELAVGPEPAAAAPPVYATPNTAPPSALDERPAEPDRRAAAPPAPAAASAMAAAVQDGVRAVQKPELPNRSTPQLTSAGVERRAAAIGASEYATIREADAGASSGAGLTPPETAKVAAATSAHQSGHQESVDIDLSVALDDLVNATVTSAENVEPAPRASLDTVFRQLRHDAYRQMTVDEAQKHFDRGVTLRDAGKIDAAIPELTIASQAPRHRFAASSLLARIYRQRGHTPEAIDWFERAAEAPASNADESRLVMYELAEALEAGGEPVRALAVCLELEAEAGEYRDVKARIARLSRAQG